MRKKTTKRSTGKLTTLDDFLKEEGKLEEFEAVAIKEYATVRKQSVDFQKTLRQDQVAMKAGK